MDSEDASDQHDGSELRPRGEAPRSQQRRARALSELASQAIGSGGSTTRTHLSSAELGASAKRSYRLRLLAGTLIALIVVAAAAGTYVVMHDGIPPASSPPIPAQLTLDLAAAGYSCPSAVAWSPNGALLAVLAEHGGCRAQDIVPDDHAAVLIYDARTGKLRSRLDPAPLLAHANATLVTLQATGMSWSPDGKTLALPALASTSASPLTAEVAVLLLGINGGIGRVLVAAPHTMAASASIWNVRTGTLADTIPYPLPPALSYRWTPDGGIEPKTPLPATVTPTSFAGSPVTRPNSGVLPLWQSGIIRAISPYPSQPDASPVDVYTAAVSSWSPDGQYVAPIIVFGPAPLAATPTRDLSRLNRDACTVKGLPPCALRALLPYPDKAFAQVASQFSTLSQPGDAFAPVAWRPDGTLLATVLPSDNFSVDGTPVRVTLLNTATGATVTTLQVMTRSASGLFPTYADMFWSPTGQQLAFMDTYTSRITLWGGSTFSPA